MPKRKEGERLKRRKKSEGWAEEGEKKMVRSALAAASNLCIKPTALHLQGGGSGSGRVAQTGQERTVHGSPKAGGNLGFYFGP